MEFKELGTVCEFKRGQMITKAELSEGNIPVIAGGREPAYFHGSYNRFGETVVVAGSGAYAGFVSYWAEPVFLSDSFSVNPNRELAAKYVYYYLKNKQELIHRLKRGGGVPHVYGKDLARLKIPVPPLTEQRRIVSILDRFDALVNDITVGLPAELAARRKQYEYYRDRLLTFKPHTDSEEPLRSAS